MFCVTKSLTGGGPCTGRARLEEYQCTDRGKCQAPGRRENIDDERNDRTLRMFVPEYWNKKTLKPHENPKFIQKKSPPPEYKAPPQA